MGPGVCDSQTRHLKNSADCICSQQWTFADMDPPLHPDTPHHRTVSSVPSFTDDTCYLPDFFFFFFNTRLVSWQILCVLGEITLYRNFQNTHADSTQSYLGLEIHIAVTELAKFPSNKDKFKSWFLHKSLPNSQARVDVSGAGWERLIKA